MKARIAIDLALSALKKNLADHLVELSEAKSGWTEKVIVEITKLRDAVSRKSEDASNEALQRLFYSRPVDNRRQYSKFISILERAKESGESHVELDEDDSDNIFNDNWDWRIASRATNTSYSKRN